MENAVEIKGLRKSYKDFTLDVSAVIPKGFAAALIGANGAGKTTLIDTLCGVTSKTDGEAVYFGNMTDTDDDALRNRIGYCSAANYFPLDWKLKTIAECMAILLRRCIDFFREHGEQRKHLLCCCGLI